MHDSLGNDPSAIRTSASQRPDLSGMRILIADDNAVNRFILSRMLDLARAETVVVNDGREAIDAWKSQCFDIALLDISMPKMSGLTALAEIRDHEAAQGRPPPIALAVTAHTMGHELNDYRDAGFSGTVPKPLRLTALYTEICSALAMRRPQRQVV